MLLKEEKSKELQLILERFTRFIKAHIQKFNPQKKGIDPDDYNGFVDSDQNGSQFKVYLLTIN